MLFCRVLREVVLDVTVCKRVSEKFTLVEYVAINNSKFLIYWTLMVMAHDLLIHCAIGI